MNLQQLNNALTSTIDLAAGLAVPTAIAYTGGYIYGALSNADKGLAARAFMTSIWVLYAFQAMVHYATNGERANPKAFYATQLLGTDCLGIVQIIAYRKLNLIGMLGTAVFSAFLLIGSLTYLNKLDQFYKPGANQS